MNFPDNLRYTKEHEWLRAEGANAVIGITEFASNELGDIVFLEIETVGEKLTAGDSFGTVEAVKTVSDLFMPVSGEVLEVNPELQNNPELVNKDPYGKGWLIRIRMNDPEEVNSLLSSAEYTALTSH